MGRKTRLEKNKGHGIREDGNRERDTEDSGEHGPVWALATQWGRVSLEHMPA